MFSPSQIGISPLTFFKKMPIFVVRNKEGKGKVMFVVICFILAVILKPFFAKDATDWETSVAWYGLCITFTPIGGIFFWRLFGGH